MIIVYSVFVFLFATAIGSFLNVVIYRLPRKMNLAKPASHCPKCDAPIKWYDNIPILSYIILRGKCRNCKDKISPRYLLIELLAGIGSLLIFLRFGVSTLSLFGIIMFLILIPIAFIDIELMIIPDSLVILLFILGIFGIFFNDINYGYGIVNVGYKSKLIALGIVIAFTFIIVLLEKLLKRDLMGGGDIKLLFCSGILLGWQLTILVLCFSSILACICEIFKQGIKKKKEEAEEDEKQSHLFAFAPYIAISMVLAYTFGINLIEFWLQLIA